MEQTQYPTSGKLQLERLVADALVEIERSGYSGRTRDRYRATWKHLVEFSRRKELGDEFSADLATRFLEQYRVRNGQVDGSGDGWRRHVELGIKVLADFDKNERSPECRQSIFFPPCRAHFVITNSTVEIGSTLVLGPFTGVRQISRSSWIFSIQGKHGP